MSKDLQDSDILIYILLPYIVDKITLWISCTTAPVVFNNNKRNNNDDSFIFRVYCSFDVNIWITFYVAYDIVNVHILSFCFFLILVISRACFTLLFFHTFSSLVPLSCLQTCAFSLSLSLFQQNYSDQYNRWWGVWKE